MDYNQKILMENVEQSLIEKMADFLDDTSLATDLYLAKLKEPDPREKSELHIRMAKAAFTEFKNTILTEGTETTRTNF